MSEKSTFGRRTWDREEYAELARKRKEAFKQGHDSDFLTTQAKKPKISSNNIDFHKDLNKRTLITGNITQTRGKAFGFYCEVCNLTFKDNLKFIDHLNSKPHLIKAQEQGEKFDGNKVITLEDVKKRYEMLCRKLDEMEKEEGQYASGFDIKKRMEDKKRQEEEKRADGIRKSKEKELYKKKELERGADQGMMDMMGIAGFGSSKK